MCRGNSAPECGEPAVKGDVAGGTQFSFTKTMVRDVGMYFECIGANLSGTFCAVVNSTPECGKPAVKGDIAGQTHIPF